MNISSVLPSFSLYKEAATDINSFKYWHKEYRLEQEQNNLQQENNSSLLDGVNPIPIVTEFDGDTFEAIGEFIGEVVGGLLDRLSF